MRGTLNVNTDELVVLTNKLEKMHKSDLPLAIRKSLTDTAWDMKKDTLQKSASRFRDRHPGNIYRTFTRVKKAEGFNVRNMEAVMGFKPLPRSDFAENQEEQNRGGTIDERTFIPMAEARGGNGQVKKKYRLSQLASKNIIDSKKVTSRKGRGGSKVNVKGKQKFIVAAIAAKKQSGNDAYVISQFENGGRRTLYHVKKAKPQRGGGVDLKLTPIYNVKGKRKVSVKKTGYITEAAMNAEKLMPRNFQKAAEHRIKKAMR